MNECVSLFYDLFSQRHNPFLKGCFVFAMFCSNKENYNK